MTSLRSLKPEQVALRCRTSWRSGAEEAWIVKLLTSGAVNRKYEFGPAFRSRCFLSSNCNPR
eukprot:10229549-Prorocentrum_lima.AAC.1